MDSFKLNNNKSEIEQLAYRFWEERGRPQGSPDEDWFRAKEMLLHESQYLSNLLNRAQLPFSSVKMGY